ncbi:hypothetical protein [Burkholderia ubonensis]|uniref:hypothetical protein n=1 Tax=Burkholderia ubonensis TaxID=101571 RepID=UPI0012FCFB2D|nr:hypothetical protein [Burkholderia ubonensis]
MEFSTSYSPVTMAFISMTKAELKKFYEWFMLNLPYCIEELMQLVRTTPGFEDWYPDCTPDSLGTLGAWLERKVQRRDLTAEEIKSIRAGLTRPIEIAEWDLTDETKSLALYVGMYYGEVALKNNPMLKWEQQMGNKRLADFGQPVIIGPGIVPINPVRIANSIAYGLVDGTKKGGQLREVYDYWEKLVMPGPK